MLEKGEGSVGRGPYACTSNPPPTGQPAMWCRSLTLRPFMIYSAGIPGGEASASWAAGPTLVYVMWTPALHTRFREAVQRCGGALAGGASSAPCMSVLLLWPRAEDNPHFL